MRIFAEKFAVPLFLSIVSAGPEVDLLSLKRERPEKKLYRLRAIEAMKKIPRQW